MQVYGYVLDREHPNALPFAQYCVKAVEMSPQSVTGNVNVRVLIVPLFGYKVVCRSGICNSTSITTTKRLIGSAWPSNIARKQTISMAGCSILLEH